MSRLIIPLVGTATLFSAGLLTIALSAQGTDEATGPREEVRFDRPALFGPLDFGQAVTPGLVDAGLQIALGGSSAGGFGMTCVACHGRDGQGSSRSAVPRIAGQPAGYLYKQLVDYAAGDRQNRIMGGVAERLTDYEMQAVSAYFGSLEAASDGGPIDVDTAILQRGGQLAAVGSTDGAITACVQCHWPAADGNGPAVPYLAGQHASYISEQLRLWQEGQRDNDPLNVMSTIAQQMTEEDIAAVSAYFASLRSQERADSRQLDMEIDIEVDTQ